MKDRIIAVIISFNDVKSLKKTVEAIYKQVTHVIVIDNGSDKNCRSLFEEIKCRYKIQLLILEKNYGIAYALNIGVNIAKEYDFNWVLTLDQDSIAEPNMVSNMLNTASKSRLKNVIISPRLVNHNNNISIDMEKKSSITSGNLVSMETYKKIGLYNEDFFIDGVDFDFNLRHINTGGAIIQCGCAFLNHELGEKIYKNLFIFQYVYIKHSPLRRYYIYRNHFYLTKKYIYKNPIFILKKSIFLVLNFLDIMLFDDEKKLNIIYIYYGISDYFNNITGIYYK